MGVQVKRSGVCGWCLRRRFGFGEGLEKTFEEGEEDIHRIANEEGQRERRDGSLGSDGEVVEQADDGTSYGGDKEAGGIGWGGNEGVIAHLALEIAQKISAGSEERVKDRENAGIDRSVEDGDIIEKALGEVAHGLVGRGGGVAGLVEVGQDWIEFEGGAVLRASMLFWERRRCAGKDEPVEFASAGVDKTDGGGVFL